MCFLAFTFSISYYGVLLGINTIAEQSFYYGFFMNFIGEVISLLSSGIISDCLGRKVVMVISSFLAGILFILYYILRLILKDKIINYSGIFVGIISFCISAGYNIQGILSNEIFPTAIKSTCNGLINIIGKLASVVVPVVIYFAEDYILIIFGGFLLIGGFFAFNVDDKVKDDEEELN
jgi:MFS family permease